MVQLSSWWGRSGIARRSCRARCSARVRVSATWLVRHEALLFRMEVEDLMALPP